ncbi:hypothetical protein TSUD_98850 [Trifolium subterraneum]|uniref:Uncharacterized protein n=1 Tax=Trifolium subterraneum TaxID=3900 RepID=A0A2Z6NXG9_TRISU|nr:hypothetical protein TSUD_98850 [Trifolium subterraneum]
MPGLIKEHTITFIMDEAIRGTAEGGIVSFVGKETTSMSHVQFLDISFTKRVLILLMDEDNMLMTTFDGERR